MTEETTAVTNSPPPPPLGAPAETESDDDLSIGESKPTAYDSLYQRVAGRRRAFGNPSAVSEDAAEEHVLPAVTADLVPHVPLVSAHPTGRSVFDTMSDDEGEADGEADGEAEDEDEDELDLQPEMNSPVAVTKSRESLEKDDDSQEEIKESAPSSKQTMHNDTDEEAEDEDEQPPVAPSTDAQDDNEPTESLATDPASASKEGEQPDADELMAKTDILFAGVTDKQAVTVKQIFKALQEDYTTVTLNKASKAVVRTRLIQLINEEAENDNDEEEEEEESVVGDADSSASEADPEDADDDEEEDEYSPHKKKRSSRPGRTRKKASTKKPKAPKHNKKVANKAARVQAELRKRRVEELRVRNEELQLNQSKEDQERAEQIAAKFDTNTDEMLKQRTHQRLNLLQKLDKKRIAVVQESKFHEDEENEEDDTDEDEDSEDEMELEFVGESKQIELNLPKSNALTLLNLNDRVRQRLADAKGKPAKPRSSPGQSLQARAALKHQLLSRRRRMGNLWLARELGYKTEKEHLRDCRESEERKRMLTLQREEERLKLSERRQERERRLALGEMVEDEEELPVEEPKESSDNEEEEEDEEMEQAKALQQDANDQAAQAPDAGEINSELDDIDPLEEDEQKHRLAGAASTVDAVLDDREANDFNGEEESADTIDEFPVSHAADGASDGTTIRATGDPSSQPQGTSSEAAESTLDTAETEMDKADDAIDENVAPNHGTAEGAEEPTPKAKSTGPRNAAWKAMLQKDAERAKKLKKRKGGLVDEEAEEEEEEEVAGLEDFGFTVKKKKDGDEDDIGDDELDEDDLKDVVDDLSDDEGDEEAGEVARKTLEQEREKELHKEAIRRMRDGYDGRRGGIAGGGAGARGMHRFDQLVAADNREDAKRLGLLNDDELDSDQEDGEKPDEEEDEAALLDKMLKDRFLHRSNVDIEETFSDDEADEDAEVEGGETNAPDDLEDKEQEKLAKRFAKRARMQRLVETYGHEEEFSQSRLIDEDTTMKIELQRMKNGLSRKRSVPSDSSNLSRGSSVISGAKRQKAGNGGGFLGGGSSLSLALQASRRKNRTTFVRNASGSNDASAASFQKSIAFNHVVFHSNSTSNMSTSSKSASRGALGRSLPPATSRFPGPSKSGSRSTSLWSKVVVSGFQKRT